MIDDDSQHFATSFNKRYPVYGKLKVVYDSYHFSSHKSCRQYYTDIHYKRMIDYLYDALSHTYTKNIYMEIIPQIESLTAKQFKFMIGLIHDKKIEVFINLLKISSRK